MVDALNIIQEANVRSLTELVGKCCEGAIGCLEALLCCLFLFIYSSLYLCHALNVSFWGVACMK